MAAVAQLPRASYDPFAAAYNRTMAEDFCQRAFPILERLLLKDIAPPAPLLDVCCGTGQMARELARRGYVVTGLDSSECMARLARQNAPCARLLVADSSRFALPAIFAAAIATFNSLAHANDADELELVFRNVRRALTPDGVFLFDVSMEEQYRKRWQGSFANAEDDMVLIVRPSYDPAARLARNEVCVFQRHGLTVNRWIRSDFTILQKCHTEEELRRALAQAGFAHVTSYDAERDLEMAGEAGRRFFVCR